MEGEQNVSKGMFWTGWVISILPCLLLIMSAAMKFIQPPGFDEGLKHMGWDARLMTYLGVVELTGTLLYLIPRTSVLGAILLTAYMGGAIATHVRVGDWFFVQILLGVMVWGGLYLRDIRIRRLIPFRS
jgi:uncharacterized membrane protein YphA (DoxX/SURF4 family)